MRMRWRWRWLGIAAVVLALGWALVGRLEAWRNRGELRLAQHEIARGQLGAAQRRLAALATRPGALGGAADYWLGICESLGNHPDAALRAFARLPEGYAFDAVGAYHEAKANLTQGKLHAAERRLEQALARGGPGLDQVRDLLGQIYQIEVRFDDVKALLRAGLAEAKDPIRVLKELSNLELDRLPYDGLQGALEKAGELAPADDRVWLGKGRLAIEAGRWEEAREWLGRCRGGRADAPVWRAWIELARGSGRARPCARSGAAARPRAARHRRAARAARRGCTSNAAIRGRSRRPSSDGSGMNPRRQRRWNASPSWPSAPASPIESPTFGAARPRWSGHLRPTGTSSGATSRSEERPSGARWPAGRSAAGRRPEARALYLWAVAADPELLAGPRWPGTLDRFDTERRRDLALHDEPWPSAAVVARPGRPEPAAGPVGGLSFTDDAEAAGLRFVYDNAETLLHQLPEPFGGGLALLDYDGDGWLDVYCVQGGPFTPASQLEPPPPNSGDRLFHNRGDGHFDDVTDASGIGRFPRGHGHGVAVGDVDGDGHPDLFVTRWRSYALYRNKGDGTFEDITTRAGLGGDRDWPTSAALADLDGDGDLDLYVCHYAAWDIENPRLCRNHANNAYLNCNPLEFRGSARSPVPQ